MLWASKKGESGQSEQEQKHWIKQTKKFDIFSDDFSIISSYFSSSTFLAKLNNVFFEKITLEVAMGANPIEEMLFWREIIFPQFLHGVLFQRNYNVVA